LQASAEVLHPKVVQLRTTGSYFGQFTIYFVVLTYCKLLNFSDKTTLLTLVHNPFLVIRILIIFIFLYLFIRMPKRTWFSRKTNGGAAGRAVESSETQACVRTLLSSPLMKPKLFPDSQCQSRSGTPYDMFWMILCSVIKQLTAHIECFAKTLREAPRGSRDFWPNCFSKDGGTDLNTLWNKLNELSENIERAKACMLGYASDCFLYPGSSFDNTRFDAEFKTFTLLASGLKNIIEWMTPIAVTTQPLQSEEYIGYLELVKFAAQGWEDVATRLQSPRLSRVQTVNLEKEGAVLQQMKSIAISPVYWFKDTGKLELLKSQVSTIRRSFSPNDRHGHVYNLPTPVQLNRRPLVAPVAPDISRAALATPPRGGPAGLPSGRPSDPAEERMLAPAGGKSKKYTKRNRVFRRYKGVAFLKN
jgi:hypothetical protein